MTVLRNVCGIMVPVTLTPCGEGASRRTKYQIPNSNPQTLMFVLKHTNPYKETFWFVRLGVQWPHRPECRLIDATTPKQSEARIFATAEDAREVLVVAGAPLGWEVTPISGPRQ